MSLRAIVFDLDDTLYPEREYAFSGFDAVADAFTDALNASFDLAERMRQLFDSPNRSRVFNVVLEACNRAADDQLLKQMIHTFRNHSPNIQLLEDADRAINRLQSQFKLGLVTDGYAVTQHAKIRALDLSSRLDAIIVTDDLGREFWKPHPRAFETISEQLGVKPTECAYIADNPAKDFVAPNALGWTTFMIEREGAVHTHNDTASGGTPQQQIRTLDELQF